MRLLGGLLSAIAVLCLAGMALAADLATLVTNLTTGGYSERDAAQLLQNVRTKVPSSMRVDIRRVDVLERTALGKTPFVIHRPAVREMLRRARSRGAE